MLNGTSTSLRFRLIPSMTSITREYRKVYNWGRMHFVEIWVNLVAADGPVPVDGTGASAATGMTPVSP